MANYVSNKSTGQVLVPSCHVARTIKSRLIGLMGSQQLDQETGMWIEPCNSIHTFFMRYPIDVVYLDKDGCVLSVYSHVQPWRVHWPVAHAKVALELPSGVAALKGISRGEVLCLS